MSAAAAPALGTLVRVTVRAGERSVDLGAPGNVPVAELVPGLARTLALLDATTVHGGFRLVRPDGVALDSDRGLQAQGVVDGAVLTVESGAAVPEVRVYDDVVEAVADAVEGQYAPWTPQDSALTAVVAACAFLLTGGGLLLGVDPASPFPPVVAGAGALLTLGAAALVGRAGSHADGSRALALTAALLGLVAGLTTAGAPGWGLPTAFAGLGMLAVAALAVPVLSERREVLLAPGLLGLTLAMVGAVVHVSDAEAGGVLAVVVALAVTAGNAIPWLALASTPLRVVAPRNDAEILLDPDPLDVAAVREQYARGHRTQVALRLAVGALALAGTPAVVATGVPGTLLMTAAFAGMLLGVRQTYSRQDVVVVMGAGVVGLTLTGVLAAAAHPTWRPALAVVAGTAAALVIALSLVAPRQRVAMGRAADTLELACLAALLPLGVAAAGLI